MWVVAKIHIILLLLSSAKAREKSFSLIVDINVPGLIGSVVFTQEHKYYPVSIRTELEPKSQDYKFGWEIYETPILWAYSDDDYCTRTVYNSLLLHNLTQRHGLISSRALYSDEFLKIDSFKESIAGHTLVLVGPQNKPISCSTIFPLTVNQTIVSADFSSSIGGEIYFMSYFDTIYKKTMILGNIYKIDGVSNIRAYDWYIGSVNYEYSNLNCQSNWKLDSVMNPNFENSDQKCNLLDGANCVLGNLTAKHGPIYPGVSMDWSTSRPFSLKDPNLSLEGINSIMWHALYVVETTTGTPIGCAIIRPREEFRLHAIMQKSNDRSKEDILGMVYFRQPSPYHSTYVKIRIKDTENMKIDPNNLPNVAIFELFPLGLDCNYIGNIMVDNNRNAMFLLSTDQYVTYNNGSVHAGVIEIGFISAYTLFGKKSILGRTVALLESNPENTSISYCGQITPVRTDEMVTTIAKFSGTSNISGYLAITQYIIHRKYMQFSDSIISLSIDNLNGHITTGHKLHIHDLPPKNENGTLNCDTVGSHYNPYNVSNSQPMYGNECKGDFMKRCEVGDINGKHGLYDVGRTRKQFIDTNMPLFGPYSVIGRSAVIHGPNREITMLGCGTFEKLTY